MSVNGAASGLLAERKRVEKAAFPDREAIGDFA
jgi:hypothetical protein